MQKLLAVFLTFLLGCLPALAQTATVPLGFPQDAGGGGDPSAKYLVLSP